MKKVGFYFDLDGTLIDSEKDLLAATKFALGGNISFNRPFREILALGSKAMLYQMMSEVIDDKQLPIIQKKFLRYYSDNIAIHSNFYNGVDKILLKLQKNNIPHGIATNKSYALSEKLMQELLPDWGGVIIGDQMVEEYTSKPAPDRLLKVIELTNNQEGENFYFGDYQTDIEAAKRAGCYAVALRFGFHEESNPPENWGADTVIDTPEQMTEFIQDNL